MGVNHFRDLLVWQKGHNLFIMLASDIRKFPRSVVSRIISWQIVDSVGGISANIAEGFNAISTKEYIHYLDIAKRTTAESENWYHKILDLRLLQKDEAEDRIKRCQEIARMIQGLIKSLQSKKRNK